MRLRGLTWPASTETVRVLEDLQIRDGQSSGALLLPLQELFPQFFLVGSHFKQVDLIASS